MVDAAETIVVGRTSEVYREDDEPCPGIPADDCVPWRVEVAVEEQLVGQPTGSRIVVNFDTHVSDQLGDLVQGGLLPAEGERGVFVLSHRMGSGLYNPVTIGAMPFAIHDGVVAIPPGAADPVSQHFAGQTWSQVREEILAAVRRSREK